MVLAVSRSCAPADGGDPVPSSASFVAAVYDRRTSLNNNSAAVIDRRYNK